MVNNFTPSVSVTRPTQAQADARAQVHVQLHQETADAVGELRTGVQAVIAAVNSEIAALPTRLVASVAGKTGAVSLTKSDVGLTAVDNTADVDKPMSTATQVALAQQVGQKLDATAVKPVALSGAFADLIGKPDLTAYLKVEDIETVTDFVTTAQLNALTARVAALEGQTGVTAPTTAATITSGATSETTQIINWSTVANATGYQVEHKLSSATAWSVDATNVTATSFTFNTLISATSYDYRVRAYNAGGSGPYSTIFTKSTSVGTSGRPAAPTGQQPTFWLRGDQISFSGTTVTGWTDAVGGVTSGLATGMTAPAYAASVSTGLNSKSAVSINNGSTQGLFWPKKLTADSLTILMVVRFASTSVSQRLIRGANLDGTSSAVAPYVNMASAGTVGAQVEGSTNSPAYGTTALASNVGYIVRASWGAASGNAARALRTTVNNGNVGTVNTSAFTPAPSGDGFYLGNFAAASQPGQVYAEVLIFENTVLGATDLAAWQQYLASIYNITLA